MFTPTLRCECAQPGLIDTMQKWSTDRLNPLHHCTIVSRDFCMILRVNKNQFSNYTKSVFFFCFVFCFNF